jgi:hypothetical protein
MAIRRFKPTPRQELIGRIALVALSLLGVFLGARLGWLVIRAFIALAQDHVSDRPGGLVGPFAILAGVLIVVGGALIALAFVPGRDRNPWPWRANARLNRAFDWFWEIVRQANR